MTVPLRPALERVVSSLAVRRYPTIGLALVRIIYGICLLVILATNASDWRALWGVESIYPNTSSALDEGLAASPNLFMISETDTWVVTLLCCSALTAITFTIGFCTRISTILVAILCWSLSARNPLISDGGDNLMVIALFLLCFASTAERLSVDSLLARHRSAGARSGIRVWWVDRQAPYSIMIGNVAWLALVAQVCILYCTSGLAKVQGRLWQEGTAVYYVLRSAEFSEWPALSEVVFSNGYLTTTATYVTVLIQVFFPFLVFNRILKLPTIAVVVGMHASIGILMGLPVFALIMIGTEMIFVPDSAWGGARAWTARAVRRLAFKPSVAQAE